jgi:hypothetical protein
MTVSSYPMMPERALPGRQLRDEVVADFVSLALWKRLRDAARPAEVASV